MLAMRRVYQKPRVLASGRDVFVGIDVHKKSFHVTARCEGGGDLSRRNAKQVCGIEEAPGSFQGLPHESANEAGPSGFWLYDRLMEDGIETIVVPPSLITVESGNRVKTNRRDSRKLSKLLESGLLKKVHVLTEKERSDRELVRTRRQLVHHRADVARQVKSELLFHGIGVPFPESPYWSGEFHEWIRGFSTKHATLRKSFDPLIRLYEDFTVRIREITKDVVELSITKDYRDRVKTLTTVPVIGTVTAMEILVELPRIEQFRTHIDHVLPDSPCVENGSG